MSEPDLTVWFNFASRRVDQKRWCESALGLAIGRTNGHVSVVEMSNDALWPIDAEVTVLDGDDGAAAQAVRSPRAAGHAVFAIALPIPEQHPARRLLGSRPPLAALMMRVQTEIRGLAATDNDDELAHLLAVFLKDVLASRRGRSAGLVEELRREVERLARQLEVLVEERPRLESALHHLRHERDEERAKVVDALKELDEAKATIDQLRAELAMSHGGRSGRFRAVAEIVPSIVAGVAEGATAVGVTAILTLTLNIQDQVHVVIDKCDQVESGGPSASP